MDIATTTPRRRWLAIAGATVFSITVLALWLRTRAGVGFTDESLYVALPYSFTLGHRPLADELAIHQLAGLVSEPLVRAHLWMQGSSSGLVLFMRRSYVAVAVVSALVAARSLRRVAGTGPSLAVAALVIAFVPFCIPNLGYNTVASFELVCGLFSLNESALSSRPDRDLFIGTVCLALATIAYPPLAVATLPATAAFAWLAARRVEGATMRAAIRQTLPVWIAGVGVLILLVVRLAPYLSAENLSRMIELNDSIGKQGGGAQKLEILLGLVAADWKLLAAQAATFTAAALVLRFVRPTWLTTAVVLLTGPALLAASPLYVKWVAPYTTIPFAITTLALGSPVALALSRRALPQPLLAGLSVVAATSLIAGVVVAWSTANGLSNAALGVLPAALITLALLARTGPTGELPPSRMAIPPLAFATSLVAFTLFELATHVYDDAPMHTLTETVETGPFAGLKTTPERRDFIEQLQSDLKQVASPDRTILFYDYFPAGYLMSEARPRTAALWMFLLPAQTAARHETRSVYARAFDPPRPLPDVTVELMKMLVHVERKMRRPPWDPVRVQLQRGGYTTRVTRDRYTIAERARSAALAPPPPDARDQPSRPPRPPSLPTPGE